MILIGNAYDMRPLPFTLRQLQYAAAVAGTGGFRKAAEACAVSQPALSAQLGALERALGARLFERGPRRVLVTPEGSELLARARSLLAGAEELVEAARALRGPLAGTLQAGVLPTIGPYALPEVSRALARAFPSLRPAWREEKTASLVAAVVEGSLDAALLARESDLGALETAVVARDPFVLAVPRGHRLAGKGPVRLGDLAGEPVLLLEEEHCFRDQALVFCGRAGLPEGEFRATSLTTLARLVASGAGVALLPALAVRLENRRRDVVVRPLAAPVPSRTVVVAFRRTSPRAAAFRDLAKALARAWPR